MQYNAAQTDPSAPSFPPYSAFQLQPHAPSSGAYPPTSTVIVSPPVAQLPPNPQAPDEPVTTWLPVTPHPLRVPTISTGLGVVSTSAAMDIEPHLSSATQPSPNPSEYAAALTGIGIGRPLLPPATQTELNATNSEHYLLDMDTDVSAFHY